MNEHKVQFGTLNENGTLTNVRYIRQEDIQSCPHCIMVQEHYNEDGTCRCKDKAHTEMKDWGYNWRDGEWR
jgi:hypothetical protein